MKTTEEARAILRAYADDTQWSMGREVKDSLSDLLDDVEELQAESEAHAKWLEESWPTIEDRALGDLVRERDENEEIAKRALGMGLEFARQLREWHRGWFGGEDLPDQTR